MEALGQLEYHCSIFGKRSGLCRCVFVLGVVSMKAKSSDDSFN
jgi:hypothetical protein